MSSLLLAKRPRPERLQSRFERLGRLHNHINQLQQALDSAPANAEARLRLARAYLMLRQWEKAEAQYRLLLSSAPTHLEARLQLSGLYAQRDKLASALRVCQEALAHSPPDSALYKIYFTLGHLYHAQGRIEEAEAALERTLALEPTHAQAYNNLGNIHLEKNDLQQAATAYQKAFEVAPDFAEAHYNLGRLYAQQETRDKAVRQYQAALRADSTYARAHYALGVLYQEVAQPRQAIRAYKHFLAQWRGDPRLTQSAQEALARLAVSQ